MIDAKLKAFSPPSGDMEKINRFTRREFKPEEIYTFSVILCDNEVDRDGECFTLNALNRLAELFVGKTGIFDHNPTGKNQTARIYETSVVCEERMTCLGEKYACLKAKAYMVRNGGNTDLIQEIDGGIKKEVSVGCSVASIRCSICGADPRSEVCRHEKGQEYGGKPCCHLLDDPTDAYEWSFVAVPAQKNAGVTKGYHLRKEEMKLREIKDICKALQSGEPVTLSKEEAARLSARFEALQKEAELGTEYRQELEKDVLRLAFLTEDTLSPDVLESVTKKMDITELKAFQSAYQSRLSSPDTVQLAESVQQAQSTHFNEFKI